MTPESIKKDLNTTAKRWAGWIEEIVAKNAIAYIEQLEEQTALMRLQMQGDCGVCKHYNEDICDECLTSTGHPKWEYEGLPELNKEENT